MTAAPGAESRARADGLYVWRPPNYATASVAVQSRWEILYEAPAAVRSLAVDVHRQAHIFADIAAPADARSPIGCPASHWLRVLNVPTAPFRGRYRVLLSLGEVTDLVIAHVALTPCVDPGGGWHAGAHYRGCFRGGVRPRPFTGGSAAERGEASRPDDSPARRCNGPELGRDSRSCGVEGLHLVVIGSPARGLLWGYRSRAYASPVLPASGPTGSSHAWPCAATAGRNPKVRRQ